MDQPPPPQPTAVKAAALTGLPPLEKGNRSILLYTFVYSWEGAEGGTSRVLPLLKSPLPDNSPFIRQEHEPEGR